MRTRTKKFVMFGTAGALVYLLLKGHRTADAQAVQAGLVKGSAPTGGKPFGNVAPLGGDSFARNDEIPVGGPAFGDVIRVKTPNSFAPPALGGALLANTIARFTALRGDTYEGRVVGYETAEGRAIAAPPNVPFLHFNMGQLVGLAPGWIRGTPSSGSGGGVGA